MNALTHTHQTQDLQAIREEIARLTLKRDGLIWSSYTARGKRLPDTSDIDNQIRNLYACLPEWQKNAVDTAAKEKAEARASDTRQFQGASNPESLKSALSQIQDVRRIFERLDLQGHCKSAVRQLNTIERDIHATLSDIETSEAA